MYEFCFFFIFSVRGKLAQRSLNKVLTNPDPVFSANSFNIIKKDDSQLNFGKQGSVSLEYEQSLRWQFALNANSHFVKKKNAFVKNERKLLYINTYRRDTTNTNGLT